MRNNKKDNGKKEGHKRRKEKDKRKRRGQDNEGGVKYGGGRKAIGNTKLETRLERRERKFKKLGK